MSTFSQKMLDLVWAKAKPISGVNPNQLRIDNNGRKIAKEAYVLIKNKEYLNSETYTRLLLFLT